MPKQESFGERVLAFYSDLSKTVIELPENFKIINPYNGTQSVKVAQITAAFFQKYFNDTRQRRLILGSSPARKGTAITGVPFEDAFHLQQISGIAMDDFYISQSSSNFLYEVIREYGGSQQFYRDFYMSFVCPLGLAKKNKNGHEVNCNYYEDKALEQSLRPFIVSSLKKQISFGIDTSVCYCIGSGDNFKALQKINHKYHFFKEIIPLEHPRFITQYHPQKKELYLEKYLTALTRK